MSEPRRADPARGVFETLLVRNGAPIEFDAHLNRLEESLRTLFDGDLPDAARELVEEGADGLALGRLRIAVAPRQGELVCTMEAARVEPSTVLPTGGGARLRSVQLRGGLGSHKWVDRATLPELPGGEMPLLLDREEVLEGGWANVFMARGDVLVTPPADGRILPGITRAAVTEIAKENGIAVVHRSFRVDELAGAAEVFLTGSIRGVQPVHSLDGLELAEPGDVNRLIAAGLRRRWMRSNSADAPAPAAGPPPGPLAL